MTYPPGSPGYPSAQQPTQQFARVAPAGRPDADAESRLPLYLTAVVAVLGLAVYLASFGPIFEVTEFGIEYFPLTLNLGLVIALAAALLAGVALLPRQSANAGIIAVLSVLGLLLLLTDVLSAPDGVSLAWGALLMLIFSALQAIVAVAVLLLAAGVITPPPPRPQYEQPVYGQYGAPGPYYGQQAGPQQRPGYPPQQFGGYPSGPSTGGFPPAGQPQQGQHQQSAGQHQSQHNTPTPPTGFPSLGHSPQHQQQAGPGQPPSQSDQSQSGQSQSGQSPAGQPPA